MKRYFMWLYIFISGYLLAGGFVTSPETIRLRIFKSTLVWYRPTRFSCEPGPYCKGWQLYAPDIWRER